MGWKNVKEHYRIGHIVQVCDGKICIGSGYLPMLIVISRDGLIEKAYREEGNPALTRYQREMDADLVKLRELVTTPDKFEHSITVYTYKGCEIIEKQCEVLGWPNVTHDGELMYGNTFSGCREDIIRAALENALAARKLCRDRMKEVKERYNELKRMKAEASRDIDSLAATLASATASLSIEPTEQGK